MIRVIQPVYYTGLAGHKRPTACTGFPYLTTRFSMARCHRAAYQSLFSVRIPSDGQAYNMPRARGNPFFHWHPIDLPTGEGSKADREAVCL